MRSPVLILAAFLLVLVLVVALPADAESAWRLSDRALVAAAAGVTLLLAAPDRSEARA